MDLKAIELYASLRATLGSGEAACLAMVVTAGWMIASDERRLFRRQVVARLGEDRLMTTVRLYVLAINAGLLSVEQADQDKDELERRRFKTGVASFRERKEAMDEHNRLLADLILKAMPYPLR